MPGARRTRGPVCIALRNAHTSIQVKRKQSGIPCADGFTAYIALSSGNGFLAPVACVDAEHHHKLGASVAAPGPRDFAVRGSAARRASPPRPPHPGPTFVTTRTPLMAGRNGKTIARF
jgi:hypothetical protein